MKHEQQLVQEGEAPRHFVRLQMESETASRAKVEDLPHRIGARKTDEYFHDINETNIAESHRSVSERDRALFEGGAFLHEYEEEKEAKREVTG